MPGFGEGIRRPWAEARSGAACQALVAHGDGTRISSAGNRVHSTGISWAGLHGYPVGRAPGPGEVSSLSGACIAIPRSTWMEVGGFPDDFFLYHEDTDLSLRLRLAGGTLGWSRPRRSHTTTSSAPTSASGDGSSAIAGAVLIRVYPTRLLVLLLPALIATEAALAVISARGGWGRQKLHSVLDVVRWLPRPLRERRAIQATRSIEPAEFADYLTADLDGR